VGGENAIKEERVVERDAFFDEVNIPERTDLVGVGGGGDEGVRGDGGGGGGGGGGRGGATTNDELIASELSTLTKYV